MILKYNNRQHQFIQTDHLPGNIEYINTEKNGVALIVSSLFRFFMKAFVLLCANVVTDLIDIIEYFNTNYFV